MSTPWNDINFVGSSSGTEEETQENNSNTVEEAEEEIPDEVRLISAEWKPGPQGFEYNKQCFLEVKAEFLRETIRTRLRGKLFGIYNDIEEDLAFEVEGFINKDSLIAKLNVKSLYFIHDEHYKAWQQDKNTPAKYLIKGIMHSRGANEIDGPVLEIPAVTKIFVNYLELPDVLFNHNSAVPCIDSAETLVGVIVAALIFAHQNSGKEVILYGHTDSSGETALNLDLSELRCKSIKALIDNDQQTFVQVCNDRSNVEDYQTILSVLTTTYGWECDPGSVDNQGGPKTCAALKSFQSDYNIFFEESISVDGEIGQQTWGAFFKVIREMIWLVASKEIGETNPTITYGESGTGIHPCGETFAQDANTKKGRKSRKDRRVEIVFKDPADTIDDTPYIDTIIMEPIVIKPIEEKPPVRTTPKLTGVEMWCSHEDKGKKRVAKNKQVLEIVPSTFGDKVTLSALPNDNVLSVGWENADYIAVNTTGHQTSFKVLGVMTQVKNAFWELLLGEIKNAVSPKKISVKTKSNSGITVESIIKVYPNNKTLYEVDFSKIFAWINNFNDKLNVLCKFLPAKIKLKVLIGKVAFEGGFEEDESSNLAYYKFSVKGGFDPLFGAEMEVEFPVAGILSCLPEPIQKFTGKIKGIFILKGGIAFTITMERSGVKKYSGTGDANGSLAASIGLVAKIANGKVLDARALIGTSIKLSYTLVSKLSSGDKVENTDDIKITWGGLTGEISWALFDGKFSRGSNITIIKPDDIWECKNRLWLP